jgi:hypothetical protein
MDQSGGAAVSGKGRRADGMGWDGKTGWRDGGAQPALHTAAADVDLGPGQCDTATVGRNETRRSRTGRDETRRARDSSASELKALMGGESESEV